MSLEQNSPDKLHQRPETWNDDNTLQAETVIPAPEHRDDKNDKKGLSLKTKIGLALAAIGVAGTAGMVGKSMAGGDAAPAPRAPEASAPVVPGPKAGEKTSKSDEQGTTGEAKLDGATPEFGASAAGYENDPEGLGRFYYQQYNELMIAGADESLSHSYLYGDSTDSLEFVKEKTRAITDDFIDKYFIADWQSNPALREYVESAYEVSYDTRAIRILTYGDEDQEPYVRELHPDEIVGTTEPLTTSTLWHESDNSDLNHADEVFTGVDPNTQTGGETLTWVNVDGQLKISDVSHYDG